MNVDQSNATWGLDRIDENRLPTDGLYQYTYTGEGVNVVIMDTGIRLTHQEFSTDGESRASCGFTSSYGTCDDGYGHGTVCFACRSYVLLFFDVLGNYRDLN